MFALVSSCGRQYRAEKNCTVLLDRVEGNVGDVVLIGKILLVCDENGISIPKTEIGLKGKILEHSKGDKVIVFKKRRRKHYRRKNGYRHSHTKVLIEEIPSV